jgi:hypothetical protein
MVWYPGTQSVFSSFFILRAVRVVPVPSGTPPPLGGGTNRVRTRSGAEGLLALTVVAGEFIRRMA